MFFLEKDSEIRAAIAMMNPVARRASALLCAYLCENPSTASSLVELQAAHKFFTLTAMAEADYDLDNEFSVASFVSVHGEGVVSVAMSVFLRAQQQAENRRKWGWVGKIATVTIAAAAGAFFG